MKKFLRYLGVIALLISASASAHSYKQGDINIGHAWTRATPTGAKTAAIYIPFLNHGKEADALIGASSSIADRIELHEMSDDNGVMKMGKIDSVPLDPEMPVSLKPGGMHLMVFGLKQPLKQGDMVPLSLQFQKAGTANIQVMVEAADAMSGNEH